LTSIRHAVSGALGTPEVDNIRRTPTISSSWVGQHSGLCGCCYFPSSPSMPAPTVRATASITPVAVPTTSTALQTSISVSSPSSKVSQRERTPWAGQNRGRETLLLTAEQDAVRRLSALCWLGRMTACTPAPTSTPRPLELKSPRHGKIPEHLQTKWSQTDISCHLPSVAASPSPP